MEQDLQKNIEEITKTKNPITILFSLNKIRESLLELGDGLISTMEETFLSDTNKTYKNILKEYKAQGFFKQLNAYSISQKYFKKNKDTLDTYFNSSFYYDMDFFYYVIFRHTPILCIATFLFKMAKNKNFIREYKQQKTHYKKIIFLEKNFTPFKQVSFTPDELGLIIDAIEFFDVRDIHGAVGDISHLQEQEISDMVIFFRRLTMASFTHPRYKKYQSFFLENFAENKRIQDYFIESFSNKDIMKTLSYLRHEIFKSYESWEGYYIDDITVDHVCSAEFISPSSSVKMKTEYLLETEKFIEKSKMNRLEYFGKFRRIFLAKYHDEFMDLVFGIPFLSREIFYDLKKDIQDVPEKDLGAFTKAKDLILFLSSSFILKLFEPIFITRLSKFFHKGVSHYYVIKFILTLTLSKNYNEYIRLSKFYMKLEANFKKGFQGVFLRFLQYGWMLSLLFILAMFFPFGALFWVLFYIMSSKVNKILEKRAPRVAGNMNLNATVVVLSFAFFTTLMGLTSGLSDNVSLAKRKIKTAFEAFTVPSMESVKMLSADITGAINDGSDSEEIVNILQDSLENIYKNTINFSSWISGEGQNISQNLPVQYPEYISEKKREIRIFSWYHFWDAAYAYGHECGIDVTSSYGKKKISDNLSLYLDVIREDLLEHVYVSGKEKMSSMTLASHVSSGVFDGSKLLGIMCDK